MKKPEENANNIQGLEKTNLNFREKLKIALASVIGTGSAATPLTAAEIDTKAREALQNDKDKTEQLATAESVSEATKLPIDREALYWQRPDATTTNARGIEKVSEISDTLLSYGAKEITLQSPRLYQTYMEAVGWDAAAATQWYTCLEVNGEKKLYCIAASHAVVGPDAKIGDDVGVDNYMVDDTNGASLRGIVRGFYGPKNSDGNPDMIVIEVSRSNSQGDFEYSTIPLQRNRLAMEDVLAVYSFGQSGWWDSREGGRIGEVDHGIYAYNHDPEGKEKAILKIEDYGPVRDGPMNQYNEEEHASGEMLSIGARSSGSVVIAIPKSSGVTIDDLMGIQNGTLTPEQEKAITDTILTHSRAIGVIDAGNTIENNTIMDPSFMNIDEFITQIEADLGGQAVDDMKRFRIQGDQITYIGDVLTGIDDPPTPEGVPRDFALEQNYPNPFNPRTTIDFTLSKSSDVELIVHNSLGEKVKTLIKGYLHPGKQTVNFDATGLASGVYYYTLRVGATTETQKMVVMK
jgi:hypothetical protein